FRDSKTARKFRFRSDNIGCSRARAKNCRRKWPWRTTCRWLSARGFELIKDCQQADRMNTTNTVLVVGSAGRVGQAVVAELRRRRFPVRGFDLLETPGVEDCVVGDITQAADLTRAAAGVGTLIHLAATPDDDDL